MSRPRFASFAAGDDLRIARHTVRTCSLNHGIGAVGYRFDHFGRSIVILTDHEHKGDRPDQALVAFSKGADLIVYDSMWDELIDYTPHIGWGHSTWQAGVALAHAAGAKQIACIHHAPESGDPTLRDRESALQGQLPGSFFARQGETRVIK